MEFGNADGFLLVVFLAAAFSLFFDLLRWGFLGFAVSERFFSFPKIFSLSFFFNSVRALFVCVCFQKIHFFPALILVFALDFPFISDQFVTNGGKNVIRVAWFALMLPSKYSPFIFASKVFTSSN